jgi:ABC-2 type transport system ATP-binding protein
MADTPAPPVISLRGLTKQYGPTIALDGVDLDVPPGSVFGFLGPNGAGKTTTIRLMLGLQRPTGGEARLFGELVRPGSAVLGRVGASVERPSFYSYLSASENLRLMAVLRGHPAPDDAAQVGLERAGLSGVARRAVGGFSTGMRQRLAIGLALMGDPELVILDEPTSGLDPEGVVEVRLLMTDVARRGATCFVSTHQLDEAARVCTHVAILSSGRVLAAGPIAEITGVGGAGGSLEAAYLEHVRRARGGTA